MANATINGDNYEITLNSGETATLSTKNKLSPKNIVIYTPIPPTKYAHNIIIQYGSNSIFLSFQVINTDSAAYTTVDQVFTALFNYLGSVTGTSNKRLPASGCWTSGTGSSATKYGIIAVAPYQSGTTKRIYYYSKTGTSDWWAVSAYTFHKDVVQTL